MNKHLKDNHDHWNEITPIHVQSEHYGVRDFKAGKNTLKPIELAEIGEVKGKTLLHLQCHFGMDTMSWARLGVSVTGVDFSEKAIAQAITLSKELNIPAKFICCDLFDLPGILKRKFDIIFTSYGVLCWLPDMDRWANLISHFLKRGGTFYIVEFHPMLNIFDNSRSSTSLNVTQSYFHKTEPTRWEPEGDYAEPNAVVTHPSYEWTHSMSDIINTLIKAGLKIEFMHEFPVSVYQWSPFTKLSEDGWWRVEGDKVPLMFSIKATK